LNELPIWNAKIHLNPVLVTGYRTFTHSEIVFTKGVHMEKMDVIKIAKQLIQTPSLSGHEKELAHFIRDFLSDGGADSVHIDAYGNVIAEVKGSSDYTVMLEGHMDHVPPGNEAFWDHPPYSGKQIEDMLYGRGAVDMKGALAAMLSSLQRMSTRERSVTVLGAFVVHEETVEGAAIQHIMEENKINPHLVILGEPTNLHIALGHRGRALIKVNLTGKTAHASMPDLGINSIESGAHFIESLHSSCSSLPSDPLLGNATITPISITCSPQGLPQLPDTCEILFDRRLIRHEQESHLLQQMESLINTLKEETRIHSGTVTIQEENLYCWTGKVLRVKDFFPSWVTEEDSREVILIKKALDYLNPQCIFWEFSTDGVYTASKASIPTVGFGPGDWRCAHQPNECVNVKALEAAESGYTSIINHIETEQDHMVHS